MRQLFLIFVAVAVGVVAYLALFATLVHKPLTVEVIGPYVARKQQILAATPSPRIAILAGSNGRFSHSCAQITASSGIACVNLSYAATINLIFQLDAYEAYLHAGDLVYLPLEYRSVDFADADDHVGDEAQYLVYAAARSVPKLYSWRGTLRALFSFDLRYALSGIGEMALARAGVSRRFGLDTMNALGDETGHNAAKAMPYRAFVTALPKLVIDRRAYGDIHYWADVDVVVRRLRARGVIVVGGLPTTFDDTVIPAVTIGFLQKFYADRGGCFVMLPNRSLYPRAAFYDTNFHLGEATQHLHSAAVGPLLANIFLAGRCPAP